MVTVSRQQIENELMALVRQRQTELQNASAADKHAAEQKLLSALQVFTAFAVDGKLPDTHAKFDVRDEDEDQSD